jgi:hypothetical protein
MEAMLHGCSPEFKTQAGSFCHLHGVDAAAF